MVLVLLDGVATAGPPLAPPVTPLPPVPPPVLGKPEALPAQPPQDRSTLPGAPFPFFNPDHESALVSMAWSYADGRSVLDGGHRICGVQSTVQSKALLVAEKPTLGGDYWDVPFPAIQSIGQRGRCWLVVEDGATFLSTPFTTQWRYLTILTRARVAGRARIEIRRGGGAGEVLLRFDVPATRGMQRQTIDLYAIPQAARWGPLRIGLAVDAKSGAAFEIDDFGFSDALAKAKPDAEPPPATPAILWGFADAHAHLFNHLGFGGKLFHGRPWAPEAPAGLENAIQRINAALPSCCDVHGGALGGASNCRSGIAITPESGSITHPFGGYPEFDGWPRASTTLIHQQVYVDWLERAWRGGLRLVSALVGHNQFIAAQYATANRTTNPVCVDDACVIDTEIRYARDYIGAHPWMQIVTTPEQARQVIREGKLAVILGLEMDQIANWRRGDFGCRDETCTDPKNDAALADGKARIAREVERLYALGVRQITPIHVYDNALGAAAIAQRLTDIANHTLIGRFLDPMNGFRSGVRYRADLDDGVIPWVVATLAGASPDHPRQLRQQFAWEVPKGFGAVNKFGLTWQGRIFLQEMMKRGMLIDTDHMSDRSAEEAFAMAEGFDYPTMSSHAAFRDTMFGASCPPLGPSPDAGTPKQCPSFNPGDAPTVQLYQTAGIHKVASELQRSGAHMDRIARSGGVAGLFTGSISEPGWAGSRIKSDCDGTSKSWAQRYLYALQKMGGRGIMFGTDINGFGYLPLARFGAFACEGAKEDDDTFRARFIREQAQTQTNGVLYDGPIADAHAYRFDSSSSGPDAAFDETDRSIFEAIAYAKAGVDVDHFDPRARIGSRLEVGPIGNQTWIRNVARGIRDANSGRPEDGQPEQRAAWRAIRGASNPDALTVRIQRIWRRWQAMEGNNPPLQRYRIGGRDFDVNLDGMAHYGLLPDFLQDVRNIGLTAEEMAPLFRGAEDYVTMWEKAERLKAEANGRFH